MSFDLNTFYIYCIYVLSVFIMRVNQNYLVMTVLTNK